MQNTKIIVYKSAANSLFLICGAFPSDKGMEKEEIHTFCSDGRPGMDGWMDVISARIIFLSPAAWWRSAHRHVAASSINAMWNRFYCRLLFSSCPFLSWDQSMLRVPPLYVLRQQDSGGLNTQVLFTYRSVFSTTVILLLK